MNIFLWTLVIVGLWNGVNMAARIGLLECLCQFYIEVNEYV
jgi:hypothetical protein